eukprot:TRINITY_DN2575_c0_g3_i2.p1 TRINITY_DN2575_c0_g3~~TRINITY_DN2575_c0_g3_i2.p1  ORF type:complete len:249 (-),score=38.07 TRINITY_DN2575_c0_g3_i2:394-1140(-)
MAESSVANSDSRATSANCEDKSRFGPLVSDVTEMIVVRHGETSWNSCGRIQGHLDVDLNEAGRQQAMAVADRLSKESKIAAVYSSDLKRAAETAQMIANACDLVELMQDPMLRERHMGDLHGLIFREAAKLKPNAYKAFVSPNSNQEIPGGGESLDQLYERCTSSLESIAKKHRGERVVVVTHGAVIETLFKRADLRGLYQGKVMNTSVNILHLFDSGNWIVKTWGDVSHLGGTGFLESGFGGDKNFG